jgi:WD40 repeat protein
VLAIKWSPVASSHKQSYRVLLADEDNVRIYDRRDLSYKAVIKNGTGGMGRVTNAEFGWTENEVIIFSDFCSKVTVWSLISGRSVEIKDPKFAFKGYCYRPRTGLFALLSRPGAQDILTLHAPNTYFVLRTVNLASSDAQGIKWSPDGRWLAVWDTPSIGFRIFIYTADGNLYRMYSGEQDGDIEGLGARSVEWSPAGNYLAVGGHNRKVTLLSTRTVSQVGTKIG